ncbi:MAG: YegS/Rv2252/BmrU family lipid kinase [Eubacterium sp.]|nr:YegS/Rv2252/BmrU family lipid kinase [Eubacterium sp.]
MKKILFVYNAHAGKAAIRSKLADLIDMMVQRGYRVTSHPTQYSGNATELIMQEGSEYDLIICSGGDGTLDEVVTGMMQMDEKRPIGYIPMGSTNDFANSLQLPKNVRKAAEIALDGQPFACDVGQFNDNSFIYVAAFGIFTEVSYQTNQELKNLLGHAAYILEGAKSLLDIEAYEMRVEYEDTILEGEFIFGMVTNSISVGGFKQIAGKNVLLDDGVFEVTLIKRPKNPLELNEIVTSLLTRVDNTELIYSFKTGEIRFYTEKEVTWTLDGEYGGSHNQVVIKNWHRAVEIMVKSET